MPDFKQNKKDTKEINKELGFIEDQLLSIAAQLKGAIVNALEDVKDESKQVAEVLAGDVDKAIKSLAKGLDETIKNQQKLNQGALRSADIQKQIEDRAAKSLMIERKLKSLVDQRIISQEMMDQKITELNEAEEFHNTVLQEQFGIAAAIEERMGAIGAIVKGISKIPIIGELINADEVMAKIQKKAAETEGSFAKLEVAAYGFGQLLGSAFNTISDPTVIFGAILKSAGEISKQQKEFRSLTGQNVDVTDAVNDRLLTTGEYIKTATMLSKELGVNAAVVFSPETIAEAAELTENMGLGAHEAAQLAKFAQLSGKPLSEVSANMESSFKSFVGQEKVGLNFKDVMDEVGSASAAVTLSLGSNPAKIQEAAMQAKKLGLSLEQVDKIASSILDFESSIQAEMEAELLTGQNLNLEKARQLALDNDLAGLAEEIGKNQGILKAFASGNRIQQEATAKAMGMSREEMAKMIYQQKIQSGLSEEQAAKAADVSLEEAKRLDLQTQIQKSIAKITEVLAGPLTMILKFVSNGFVLRATMITIGAIMTAKIAPALVSSAKSMASMVKGSIDFLKNNKLSSSILGKFYKGGQFMKGGGRAKAGGQRAGGLVGSIKGLFSDDGGAADKAADSTSKVNKGTGGIKKGQGKIVQNFLTGIGKGLAALGKAIMGPQMVGIAVGVGLISVAMIALGAALGLAAPGIKAFGTVVTAVFDGLADMITAAADGFVKIMEAVSMENILPMLLLGPALYGIAGGLLAVGLAGIQALPVLAGLGALALVATPLLQLAGVFGGGGEGGGDETSQIVEKLDQLIAVVEAGGDVIMDGNKVGKSLTIASSGIG